jgi:peptidoglycan hydrolase-like protein with peptidoglycan-binding domain
MSDIIRKGGRGDAVKAMQQKLVKLGFDVAPDGIFGDATEHAVKELQTLFGYTVDGLVGDGTSGLMDAQIGYGWSYKAPDAKARALAAQGKAPAAGQQQSAGPSKAPASAGQQPAAPSKGVPPAGKPAIQGKPAPKT